MEIQSEIDLQLHGELKSDPNACTNDTLMLGECHGLPVCGFCYDDSDSTFQQPSTEYAIYNLIVIGLILPTIGVLGLVGNGLCVFVYSRRPMHSSLNLYLCTLACSDGTIIFTSFFLFFLESVRRRSVTCQKVFALLTPVMFPLGLTAQTLSVFFTVAAAFDCFIRVIGSTAVRHKFCCSTTAKWIMLVMVIIACIFNLPHLWEVSVVYCWSVQYDTPSYDVCPTLLRQNEAYMTLYYAYLYTIVMAAGPVVLLMVLNSAIIFIIRSQNLESEASSTHSVNQSPVELRNGRSHSTANNTGNASNTGRSGEEPTDVTTLVLVVCLFICCNILPLTVNFLELLLNVVNSYLLDLSNLMVVVNSSFNFCIYVLFGERFRSTLKFHLRRWLCAVRRSPKRQQSLLRIYHHHMKTRNSGAMGIELAHFELHEYSPVVSL